MRSIPRCTAGDGAGYVSVGFCASDPLAVAGTVAVLWVLAVAGRLGAHDGALGGGPVGGSVGRFRDRFVGRSPWRSRGRSQWRSGGHLRWRSGGRSPWRSGGRSPWWFVGRSPWRSDGRSRWRSGGRSPWRPTWCSRWRPGGRSCGRSPWRSVWPRSWSRVAAMHLPADSRRMPPSSTIRWRLAVGFRRLSKHFLQPAGGRYGRPPRRSNAGLLQARYLAGG